MRSPGDGLTGEVTIRLISEPRQLVVIRCAVKEMGRLIGFEDQDSDRLMMGVDEALTNVIKHAYEGATDRPIEVTFRAIANAQGQTGIRVVIRDQGKPVDPAKIRGRDLDDLKPGGLGVHIMQSVMDRLEYVSLAGGGTELLMEMFASTEEQAGQQKAHG